MYTVSSFKLRKYCFTDVEYSILSVASSYVSIVLPMLSTVYS